MILRRKPDQEYCEYILEISLMLRDLYNRVSKDPDNTIYHNSLGKEEYLEMIKFYHDGFVEEYKKEKCKKIFGYDIDPIEDEQ